MTTPSAVASGVGFRNLRIFALNANGYPNVDALTPYEGLLLSGVRNFEVNDPEPQLIVHLGDDAPFALDSLPAREPVTGKLSMSKQNDPIDALLASLKSFQIGEANLFGVGTDKRGFETQVGALAYRQTLDTDPDSANFGTRLWQFRILPRTTIIPLENVWNESPEERSYVVRPGFVTKHLWGTAFVEATTGFKRAQILRGVSQYKPKIVSWTGDGLQATFDFPADAPAASTAKVVAWLDGVETVPLTVTTTNVSFDPTPSDDVNIVVFYETA